MAQTLDLIPWPPDASPIYAAPAVLIPLEPRKTMLAGVKEHLYHPCLPTLRRMDMDTVANRLTDQHSRTSTTCSKEDFQGATFTVAGVPSRPVPSLVSHCPAGRGSLPGLRGPGRQFSRSLGTVERPTGPGDPTAPARSSGDAAAPPGFSVFIPPPGRPLGIASALPARFSRGSPPARGRPLPEGRRGRAERRGPRERRCSRPASPLSPGHVGAAAVAGRPLPRGEAGAAAAQHQPGGVAQLHARHAGLVPLRLRRRRVGAAQPPRQSSWLQLLCRQILKTRRHSNLEVLPQSESQPGSIRTKASSLQHSEHLQELWNCPQPLSLSGALALRSRSIRRPEAWDEPLPSF